MARSTLTLLLSALAALVPLSHALPPHERSHVHKGIKSHHHHLLRRSGHHRHNHQSPAQRDVLVLKGDEDKLSRRSDNDSSDSRSWLDEHSSLERSDLDQLLDELGLSYNDVRDLVKRYVDGDQPTACTSTVAAPTASTTQPVAPTQTRTPPNGSRNKNVVYYAQTPATAQVPLSTICNDPSIDIIVLSFITDLQSAGGWPSLNLASKCWAASAAQTSLGATGLLDCVGDGFASQVSSCQAAGKKVMLSVGGAISNLNLPSSAAASVAAQRVWELFLGGINTTIGSARPFGPSVVLDGIDIDNEAPAYKTYLPDFVKTLRRLMDNATAQGGKQYLLSAAPQCIRPDASIPIPEMLDDLDYVWVQFYNNPSCNVDAGQGFLDSVKAWSADLAVTGGVDSPNNGNTQTDIGTPVFGNTNIADPLPPRQPGSRKRGVQVAKRGTGRGKPQLLIGVLATQGSGYVTVNQLKKVLEQVKGLGLGNLGGVMYWDGAYHELSKQQNGGTGYADMVRTLLA